MRSNYDILDECLEKQHPVFSKLAIGEAMDTARIDTLEDLLEQFKANQKKLSPIACIGLVEELIKDIKK